MRSTTPQPHHREGKGTVPHPHHTTGRVRGQYHTTPQGGEGHSTMADPKPWPGGEGGLNAGPYIHIYIYMYACV